MATVNPYEGEQTQSREELRAEIIGELASLAVRKAYLEQVLATVDPREAQRQLIIDRFYEGI